MTGKAESKRKQEKAAQGRCQVHNTNVNQAEHGWKTHSGSEKRNKCKKPV